MKNFQFVAYSLKMKVYVIVSVNANDVDEGFKVAIERLDKQELKYDVLQLFDKSFVKKMEWLQD